MARRQVISRDDLDARRVDFSDTASGERLPPVHPGEVLRHDFLEPLGLTAHVLALALRVPANRVTAILAGERAVTAETGAPSFTSLRHQCRVLAEPTEGV